MQGLDADFGDLGVSAGGQNYGLGGSQGSGGGGSEISVGSGSGVMPGSNSGGGIARFSGP